MKTKIATILRRLAHRLDPQKPEVTGYARKVIDFIPYNGIDIYRRLMMEGSEVEAKNLKATMRVLAEVTAEHRLGDRLCTNGNIVVHENFGTQVKEVNGIKCEPGGLTVVLELKGSWS